MDIHNIIGFILVVSVVTFTEVAESKKDVPKWLKKGVKKEKIRHHHGSFMGKQSSEKFDNPQAYKISCCQNGGRCIMGAFCQCKKNYFGRYCEYKSENKDCGKYKHGVWLKSGCNLCRCFDGVLNCIPRAYSGCDDKPVDIRDKYNPNDEVYVFPPEPTEEEPETNDYDGHDKTQSSSNIMSVNSVLLVILSSVVLCYYKVD